MEMLTFTLLSKNPMGPNPVPYPMQFRWDNELYFMILLMGVVFTYTPRIVLWAGVLGAITWMAGAAWIALQPDVHAAFSIADADRKSADAVVSAFLEPNTVFFQSITKHVILILLVAGGLAVAVNRARNLVYRHAAAERARANLSCHFSPNMVEALAERDTALGETKSQQVGDPVCGHRRIHRDKRRTAGKRRLRDASGIPQPSCARGLRARRHSGQIPRRRSHGHLRDARCSSRRRCARSRLRPFDYPLYRRVERRENRPRRNRD
tara:strand:- start:2680 stop:3477 length:798 start_codon:yes stop_codon:yes gene_type:complete